MSDDLGAAGGTGSRPPEAPSGAMHQINPKSLFFVAPPIWGPRATGLSLLGFSKRVLTIGATWMSGLAGSAAASDIGTSSWLLWVCFGSCSASAVGAIGALVLNAALSARS